MRIVKDSFIEEVEKMGRGRYFETVAELTSVSTLKIYVKIKPQFWILSEITGIFGTMTVSEVEVYQDGTVAVSPKLIMHIFQTVTEMVSSQDRRIESFLAALRNMVESYQEKEGE